MNHLQRSCLSNGVTTVMQPRITPQTSGQVKVTNRGLKDNLGKDGIWLAKRFDIGLGEIGDKALTLADMYSNSGLEGLIVCSGFDRILDTDFSLSLFLLCGTDKDRLLYRSWPEFYHGSRNGARRLAVHIFNRISFSIANIAVRTRQYLSMGDFGPFLYSKSMIIAFHVDCLRLLDSLTSGILNSELRMCSCLINLPFPEL
ncbi:hypothetical protein Tco_0458882 [Tanacetum coccineum]